MATVLDAPQVPKVTKPLEYLSITHSRAQTAWAILMVAAIGFVVAGSYAVYRGIDARDQVRNQLVSEQITTPDDASIPGVLVQDDVTAMAQADVIQKHALEATGGKTYAQLDREDPARQTAFNASTLRTSLMSAVLAWNVANLVIGFGAFAAAIGVLIVVGLFLIRPTPHIS
ncbi:MAG TPA: aromatic ring-opening dioxygenase LigA [Actinomycetota bacterium]